MAPKTFLPTLQTTWIARLTKDPRFNENNGHPVTSLDLVVSKRYFDKANDEWKEVVQYYQASVWGDGRANRAAKLHKGDMIAVTFCPADLVARIWGDENDKVSLNIKSAIVSPLVKMGNGDDDENGAPDAANGVPEEDIPLEEAV